MTVINPFYTVIAGPDAGDTVAAFQWTDDPNALAAARDFIAEFVADPEDFTATVDTPVGHQRYRDISLHLEVHGRRLDLDCDYWLIVELGEHRIDGRPIRMVNDAEFHRTHTQALR